MEIVLYDDCSGTTAMPAGGLYNHNMCMNDGTGIWAQNLFDNLAANKTYYLKVRTAGGYTGDLLMSALYYTPPNENCLGATSISSNALVSDNNACHKPGNVPAGQLCAITLENTAWYTYVVQSSGSSTITIDNISCDNGNGNNNNGFQIGFFRGDCNALVPITCSNGSGGTVQATANGLTGGTRIYVAIDGYSGSNCSYTITATNSFALPVLLKQFTVEKKISGNLLNWKTQQEENHAYFEVQRSTDGRNFEELTRIYSPPNSSIEKSYEHLDQYPPLQSYYRLRQVDLDGKYMFSPVIEVVRTDRKDLYLDEIYINNGQLGYTIRSEKFQRIQVNVFSSSGKLISSEWINAQKGSQGFQKNVNELSRGVYILSLSTGMDKVSQSFLLQ